jgi:Holliday junction resolvasome RuvABC endonuclease subunit
VHSSSPEAKGSPSAASAVAPGLRPDWAWGVDFKADQVDVVALPMRGHAQPRHWHVRVAAGAHERARRLHLLRNELVAHAPHWAGGHAPLAVVVEQPSGSHSNLVLVATYGMLLEAFYSALLPVFRHPVMVETMNGSTWKRYFVGRGNARKEHVLPVVLDRAGGWKPPSEDAADAFGIAYTLRAELRGERVRG